MIQRIPASHDVAGDLLRDVHPAADRHGALGEVAEFVCQDRFELAQAEHIHQSQPDHEILAGGYDEVGYRKVVEDARIDLLGKVHPAGAWGSDFVRQAVQEGEQVRFVRGRDLDTLEGLATFDENQRLQHENREKGGSSAADKQPEGIIWCIHHAREQAVGGPSEPAGEREVNSDKEEQAARGQPGTAAVTRARGSQSVGNGSRSGRVD